MTTAQLRPCTRSHQPVLLAVIALASLLITPSIARSAEPIDIGSRLELFVDDYLIESMDGAELELHRPEFKNVAIAFDKPWEGNTCCYVTVFRDGDICRAYYRGSNYSPKTKKIASQQVCYAESKDGIHWTKPKLDIVEWEGSKANNLIWSGPGSHNFAPFKDKNPDAKPDARYKAVAGVKGGLATLKSADGIHWDFISRKPVITKGAFDSQNLAFYDTVRKCYVDYHRVFLKGVRDIVTCTSQDFQTWTEPVPLDYGDAKSEHLYTNAITPYYRAPHIYMGFPKRFRPKRRVGGHQHSGVSDGVFMTSRDGLHFQRWQSAFLRPGLQPSRWVNRNNMIAWGMIETKSDLPGAPNEISIYSTEGYYVGPEFLRRHTIRLDGFVSVSAGYGGGKMTTKPITFAGKHLVMNFSTSAAGSIRVEVLDAAGKPVPGFAMGDCSDIFGDEIERTVTWKGGDDLSKLAGKPIRLRFVLKDADLYSIRFTSK